MKSLRLVVAVLFVSAGCVGQDSTAASTEDLAAEVTEPTLVEDLEEVGEEPVSVQDVDTSNAEFPAVLEVTTEPRDNNEWNFSVTISSQYDSPERYADAWRVLDSEGNELGIRVLLHDHANEQPFTRSQVVTVPSDLNSVFIEPRDLVNGWSGELTEVDLSFN